MKTAHCILVLASTALSATTTTATAQTRDTVFLEVGSPLVDGRIFKPHAARVRIYRGDSLVNEWVNSLTLGDSAGRQVMRWVTTSQPVAAFPNRTMSVLRQTYDAITLAPLGYAVTTSAGAAVTLAITDTRVHGWRRAPGNDTSRIPVDQPLQRRGFFAGASDLVPVAAGLRVGTVMVAPVWNPSMAIAEDRVFHVTRDTVVDVEGTPVRAIKVEERHRANRSLTANWYLLRESPYMVYGEVPLPDGRIQRMTEVEEPPPSRNP